MKARFWFISVAIFALALLTPDLARPCTSFLVSKGASKDGSTMITYSADSHELYGELYYRPAGIHRKGTQMAIHEWDTGKFLGKIPQAPRTYAVVGNMNEYQVAISETTYGGRKELHDPKGGLDYGSLIYLALQRSKNAREAITTMTSLADEYGYCSEGETFSIADPNEAWIMDLIGKGHGNKGAVWVARRIPDGYISAHANYARIRTFPLNDKENCMYAKDVITFARSKGYFKGKDKDFRFADAYAPLDFEALRFCEARVWQFFNRAAPSLKLSHAYVRGLGDFPRLPLWVKPDKHLGVDDVMSLMRDHFEGTELDLNKGVGAGPYRLPYRWRPLTWKVDSVEYFNERSTSTQQTGFSFVSQSRAWLPGPVGGILWFGVDDTASTVYMPMYAAAMTKIPKSLAEGTGTFTRFSWDSAFWVFNFVANFAYSRYCDIIKDIQVLQRQFEKKFLTDQPEIEKRALALYKKAPRRARAYLTTYSVKQAEAVTERWRKLLIELLMKYLDGNVRDDKGKVTHPGYPKAWYQRIARESGEKLRVRRIKGEPPKKPKIKPPKTPPPLPKVKRPPIRPPRPQARPR